MAGTQRKGSWFVLQKKQKPCLLGDTPDVSVNGAGGSEGGSQGGAGLARTTTGLSNSSAVPSPLGAHMDTLAKNLKHLTGHSAIRKMGVQMGRKLEKLTTQTVLGLDRMVHPSQHEAEHDAYIGEDVVDIMSVHVTPHAENNVLHHLRSIHVAGVPPPPGANSHASTVIPPHVAAAIALANEPVDGSGSASQPLAAGRHATVYAAAAGTIKTSQAPDAAPASGDGPDEQPVTPTALQARGDLLLLIVVHSARNLPPIMPDTNSVNPFVRLTIGDVTASTKAGARPIVLTSTTRTIYRNKNPVWEESFLFDLKSLREDTPLSAVVYHNYGTGNIRMGQARATLKRLLHRGEVNRAISSWFRLGPRNMDKAQRGQWQGLEGDVCMTQALVDRNLAPTLQPLLFSLQQLTPQAMQQKTLGKTLKVTPHSLRLQLKNSDSMAGILQALAEKDTCLTLEVVIGRTVAKRACRPLSVVAAPNDPLDVTINATMTGGGYLLVPLDNAFSVQEALFWSRKRQLQEIGDIKFYVVHSTKGTLAKSQIPCWDVPTEEQLEARAEDCDCVKDSLAQQQQQQQQQQQDGEPGAPATPAGKGAAPDLASRSAPTVVQSTPTAAAAAAQAGEASPITNGVGGRTLEAAHAAPSRADRGPASPGGGDGSGGDDEPVYAIGERQARDLAEATSGGRLGSTKLKDVVGGAELRKYGKQYLRQMDDYERVNVSSWELRVSCVLVSEENAAVLARRQAIADDKLGGTGSIVTTVPDEGDDASAAAVADKDAPDVPDEDSPQSEEAAANESMLLPAPLETSCCDCAVNATPEAIFQALFDPSHTVFKNMVAREKLRDIAPEAWAPAPDRPGAVPPKGSKRMLRYTRPLSVPAGPKSCSVEEVHEITASAKGGWVALVKVATTAPKGDCFYVNIQFAVSRVNKDSSRLVSSCAFVLVKSLGLLKAVVQGAALAGSKKGVLDRVNDIATLASNGEMTPSSSAPTSFSNKEVKRKGTTVVAKATESDATVVVSAGGAATASVTVSGHGGGVFGALRRTAAAALPVVYRLLSLLLLALLVHAVYEVAAQLSQLNHTLAQQLVQQQVAAARAPPTEIFDFRSPADLSGGQDTGASQQQGNGWAPDVQAALRSGLY